MKAIVFTRYGSPEDLCLSEIPRPIPEPHEVLIKVLAASVNKADWHLISGKPIAIRLMTGLIRPKFSIPGADISGIVERVGAQVTQFKPGDEVFGDISGSGFGAFAEFAVSGADRLAIKPFNLTFEQTAAIPMAAVTALQGLRNEGGLKPGQQVLINGASGGVGSFAVQIAKTMGAVVTAVVGTNNIDRVYSLGADEVLDYTKADFTKSGKRYDLIFDIAGNKSIFSIKKLLKQRGKYVACSFSIGAFLLSPILQVFSGKKFTNLLAATTHADLQLLSKWEEEGKIISVIQQYFTLDDVPEALELMGSGKKFGKLVVSV